jgi:hypothetical protein
MIEHEELNQVHELVSLNILRPYSLVPVWVYRYCTGSSPVDI